MIDTITPAAKLFVGGHVPTQGDIPWMSIVPIAESRSSYNGLLVFVFIAFSASVAALIVHQFGSKALRRGPAWDCGYPDPSPATQYPAAVSLSRSAGPWGMSHLSRATIWICRRPATLVPRGSALKSTTASGTAYTRRSCEASIFARIN